MARAPVFFALAALVGGPTALASPGPEQTAGHAVFTGAVSPHPSSIIGNPAALNLGTEGVHFWVGGIATVDQYRIMLRTIDAATGAASDGARVSATTWSPGGSAAVYTVQPAFNLAAMISLPPAEEQIADRSELRYLTLGGHRRERTWAAVAGALRLIDGLYVGGSASYVGTAFSMRFARDTALEGGRGATGLGLDCGGSPCGLGNPLADEIYRIETSTRSTKAQTKIAFTMGVVWKVTSEITIGAVYREPQGFNAAVAAPGVVTVTSAPRAGGADRRGDAVLEVVPPQTFELGARIKSWRWGETVVGGRWLNLSRERAYDLRMFGRGLGATPEWYPRPEGFHDVFQAWAGIEQRDDGQRFVIGGRLGFDSSATSAERISPAQVEGAALTVDLGLQVRLRPNLILDVGYGLRYQPEINVTQSAYDPIARLDCIDADYAYDDPACATVRGGYGTNTAAGTYLRVGHVARLGLRFELQ
jgi:long-subunit fatty acid transport protein